MALHIAALLVFIALFPLTAVIPLRLLASLSARRRAAQERQHVAALDAKGSLVVKGILRVEGPLPREGVRDLGAVSIWSSARRFWFRRPKVEGRARAEKLVVVAGEKRYELRGEVEVLSGSRAVFTGARAETLDRKAFAIRACLFDGDELIVAGAAAGAAEGQQYRDRGATVIEPSAGGVILASASSATRATVPLTALARHFWVALLMLVGCLPLYDFVSDYSDTNCADACKTSGDCSIVSQFQLLDFRAALAKLRNGDHVACAATSDQMCRAADQCAELGRCTADAGHCIATSAEDCRDTPGCLASGLCSPSEGFCRALTLDDCRYTPTCNEHGKCVPSDGSCTVATDESCQAPQGCAAYGRCHALDGDCAAVERADCAPTQGCRDYGRCSPVAGSCQVASDADCRPTEQCRERGRCSAVEGACVAKTSEDCVGSRRCADARECVPKDGACVPDASSCRESAACKHWGACDGERVCSASSKAECAKAEVCEGKSNCRPLGLVCATSCGETEVCHSLGWCTADGDDHCKAGSDADCAASRSCRWSANCSMRDGRCATTSKADCDQDDVCKGGAGCSFVNGRCETTAADCEATLGCKLLGKCSMGEYGCGVHSAEDCKKSEVCEKRGWCTPMRPAYAIADQCGPAPR